MIIDNNSKEKEAMYAFCKGFGIGYISVLYFKSEKSL
ncbi:hypothetical protein BN906_02044 [Clostridium tetani 12124569]|nr:hypothetical protein BN906_02044 [Clostridium tetani 12124569]